MDIEGSSLGVKRPENETNHSPENKNAWSFACTPPYVFMAWSRERFSFYTNLIIPN
jgi:hypothetical protein